MRLAQSVLGIKKSLKLAEDIFEEIVVQTGNKILYLDWSFLSDYNALNKEL